MDANWRRDAIIEFLRQQGKVSTRVLAEYFRVTRQTILQDITVLSSRCDICTFRTSRSYRPVVIFVPNEGEMAVSICLKKADLPSSS